MLGLILIIVGVLAFLFMIGLVVVVIFAIIEGRKEGRRMLKAMQERELVKQKSGDGAV